MPRPRLALKIFTATALVVVLALGVALLFTRHFAIRAAEESIGRGLAATASALTDQLESRSHTLQQVARALAQVPTYVSRIELGFQSEGRSDLLDQAAEFQQQGEADWALLTDDQGTLQAFTRSNELFGISLAGEGSMVEQALLGSSATGTWVEPDNAAFQAAAVPIRVGEGPVRGTLVMGLALDSAFAARLKRQTASEIVFVVLDTLDQPLVVASTLAGDVAAAVAGQVTFDRLSTEDTAASHLRLDTGGDTWIGELGVLRTASGAPVGGFAALRSRAVELAPYARLQQAILIAFIGGLLFASLGALLLARGIARPVRELVAVTRQVSAGNYDAEIRVGSGDEIGELAEAFKGMVAELKEKQQLVDFLSATGAHTVAMRPSIAVNAVGPIPGEVFAGRYEIKSVLGQGGMGVVYRAVDRELDEQVAIKLLHGEMVRRDASLLERFKQEIRLARRITHPNVVRTHDMGEAAGLYFITMEFVEGTSLDDLIRKRGKLPVGVTLTVARQLLRALEAAHAQGVVHRDIKPQNMIVDAQGFLKVMDFGIARLADNSKGLTMDGAVVGTPDYMAPEQLLGREVDGRADIYATGAVLFQCLTGERLFPADSLPTLIMKQVEEPARDPRTLSPEVPPALAQAILKALAKDPAARFQTAHDFAVALERM